MVLGGQMKLSEEQRKKEKVSICSYFLLSDPTDIKGKKRLTVRRVEESRGEESRGEEREKPEAVYKGRERLVSIWDNPKC